MAKLERKLTKIFANNSGSQGTTVYGSKASGTVQYSKDLDDLQSNEWEIGREAGVIANSAPVLEDDNTVDFVMSRQIKYIQQMGICEWLATETYYINSFCAYNGIVYKSIVNDNINNNPENDDGTHWEEFKSGGGGRKLFEPVFSDHILTYKEKFGLELLGEYVYKTAVAGTRYGYPDFYNKVLAEYNDPNNTDDTTTIAGITIKVNQNGHKFYDIADKSAVDTIYNNTGIAWFYGVDTANERIFLPRNDYCFVNQKNHIGNDIGVGNYFEGELPQHKHSARTTTTYDNVSPNGTVGGGNSNNNVTAYTNNVYSNSIYKDNGQVKPTGVGVYVYMCVGNVKQEEAQGQYIDFTTTNNDTIPLFTAKIFDFDAGVANPSWLRANGNYVDGTLYQTCYNKLVLSLHYNPSHLKVVDVRSLDPNTDYSEYWIVDQSSQTFRCPLKTTNERILIYKEHTLDKQINIYSDGWCEQADKRTISSAWGTITFSIPYSHNPIVVLGGGNNSVSSICNSVGNVTPTGFNAWTSDDTTFNSAVAFYRATGYISAETLQQYMTNFNKYLFFKVANAVENLEIINGAGVLSALNNKLDLTENMIPSSKYDDLTLGASGSTYVAPANGWFYLDKTATGNQSWVMTNTGNGMAVEQIGFNGTRIRNVFPVAKGDIVRIDYNTGGATNLFRFFYSTNN